MSPQDSPGDKNKPVELQLALQTAWIWPAVCWLARPRPLGAFRGQHGSGASGTGNMAQALHAGTGLNPHPPLGGFRSQHGSEASGTGLNPHPFLGGFGRQHGSGATGTGLNSTPCLGSFRGQHGSGASGTGIMAQVLHAGTGLNTHPSLADFRGQHEKKSQNRRNQGFSCYFCYGIQIRIRIRIWIHTSD